MKFFKIIVTLLCFPCFGYSQQGNYSFFNFSEKDGLTDKIIYSCTQDNSGRIWIGAANGLYYYDGYKFISMKSTKDVPGHQISNILTTVYRDTNGLLWLSSLNALQLFNPKSNIFFSFNYTNKHIQELIKSIPTCFYRDSKGNMWIATQKKYWYRLNVAKQEVRCFVPKDFRVNEDTKFTSKIVESKDGKLWAITHHGVYQFDVAGKITPYFYQENEKPLRNYHEQAFYDSKRDCIWIGSGFDGITKFDIKNKKFSFNPLIEKKTFNANPAHYITQVAPKSEDEIWFSAGGLGIYNIKTQKSQIFFQDNAEEYGFKNNPIASLYNDKEKNLWICSYSGLSQFSWQNNQIRKIPLFNSKANYTVEPYSTLDYKENDILIANNTSNGLLWWQDTLQKLTVIENPFYKGKPRELKGIISIHRTRTGKIFAASAEHFFELNTASNQLIPHTLLDQLQQPVHNITRIISDSHENLYLFSPNNGFYIYDKQSEKVMHFNEWDVDSNVKKEDSSNLICPRFVDKYDDVWFTLVQGVYKWDHSSRKFEKFANGKAKNTQALLSQSAAILQDKKGDYWITSRDNGIYQLKINNGTTTLLNYNKENCGLPSDYCNSIVLDKKGFLWIGTLAGLVKFDPIAKEVISVLKKQNGLFYSNIDVVVNLIRDRDIVISHYGGLSVLNVEDYKWNTKKANVVFTAMKILDKKVNLENISEEIQLRYNENFIRFEWFCDGLTNSNQNQYSYQLKGFEEEWTTTNINAVSFSSLPSGTYEMLVKARNNDGYWGNIKKISFVIIPPFWKTWWFYALVIGIVVGILYLFYYYKTEQLKKEERLKSQFVQDLASLEMKALRAQMNPHFIFNSLNSIQKFILKNDTFAASQYLTKFSKLIRLILDHSNQNYIPLSSEIELLKLYTEIEALRFDNQFQYEFVIGNDLNTNASLIPSMIIQPYIENAIWHGLLHKETIGKLWVQIAKYGEDCIKVVVEDDGIGRRKAQESKSKQILKKKSYGMDITHNRIDILNKMENKNTICSIIDLEDAKKNPLGTRVELIIPFKYVNND